MTTTSNNEDDEREQEYIFTCKECASHALVVVHEYTETQHYEVTLECKCGTASDGIAARRLYHTAATCRTEGYLDEDHRGEEESDPEEIEDLGEEEDEYELFCDKCVTNAADSDWNVTKQEYKVDDDEFYVYCGGCEPLREIEFGWSHPGRGGRIWPVECTDFNPFKSCPELRYIKAWLEKGWISPNLREKYENILEEQK